MVKTRAVWAGEGFSSSCNDPWLKGDERTFFNATRFNPKRDEGLIDQDICHAGQVSIRRRRNRLPAFGGCNDWLCLLLSSLRADVVPWLAGKLRPDESVSRVFLDVLAKLAAGMSALPVVCNAGWYGR